MKKYSNLFIVIFSIIILTLIFIKKELVTTTILLSLSIWLNTLVPSMAPMFVLSDILISYNFIEYIPQKIVSLISKIFNISKEGVLTLFLSIISGFPANARNIKTMYEKRFISKKESEHLLLFNHFANPLFVVQTVGTFFLNNSLYGFVILSAHIFSNFIIGIIFRSKNTITNSNFITNGKKCQSFGNVLSSSIKKAIDSLLMISGTVTIFLVLATLITNIFSLDSNMSVLIKSILEMTMGLSSLSQMGIGDTYKVVLSSMILSFGGLSVHMQVISALEGTDILYRNYFKGRIYQMVLSGFVSYIIMLFI